MNTRKLLQTALACLERNEDEAAKALLTIAAEEGEEESEPEAEAKKSEEELKEEATSALKAGDYAKAASIVKALEEGEEKPSEEEPAAGEIDSEDDEAKSKKKEDASEEEAEGAKDEVPSEEAPSSEAEGDTSPGDAVKDLPPEKVAALVTLASTIKKGGHPDLARKITRVLGL